MEQRSTWVIGGQSAPQPEKIPYVPMWKTFSKAAEEEKEHFFNNMRQRLIDQGLMESK